MITGLAELVKPILHKLPCAYLAAKSDIKLTHVPFRGSAPALTAVMGGQIHVLLDPPFTAIPAIQSGNTRALAVTGAKRSPLLPDVPTVAELGFPGVAARHWGGFFAPTGTPPAVIQKLNAAIVAALQNPKVREELRAQGLEIIGNTPEEFRKEIDDEIELWAKVINDSGEVRHTTGTARIGEVPRARGPAQISRDLREAAVSASDEQGINPAPSGRIACQCPS